MKFNREWLKASFLRLTQNILTKPVSSYSEFKLFQTEFYTFIMF